MRLSEPNPRDHRVTRQLASYKGLVARWQSWSAVEAACRDLADRLLRAEEKSLDEGALGENSDHEQADEREPAGGERLD